MAEETQKFSPPASLKRKKASLQWRGWFSTGGLAEVGGSASGRWSPELRVGVYLWEFPHVLNSRTAPLERDTDFLIPVVPCISSDSFYALSFPHPGARPQAEVESSVLLKEHFYT